MNTSKQSGHCCRLSWRRRRLSTLDVLITLLACWMSAGGHSLHGRDPTATSQVKSEDSKAPDDNESFSAYVDAEGNISLPGDYQATFVHLGTFSVSTKSDGKTDELHGVYARPEDVQGFRRDGKFPDGAVLVKDVYSTNGEGLTTGDASWAKDIKVWFVMIKDSQGRFPDNDLWGNGWGWALFNGNDATKQVATDYKTDCRACHVPAKKDDWLYLRGYPLLRNKSE